MHILFTHPGTELYGSDRMAAVTANALAEKGFRVEVVLPEHGPLVDLIASNVVLLEQSVLVLRKTLLTPGRLPFLAWTAVRDVARCIGILRKRRPDVVYVNTIIQPTWMIASFLARIPLVTHVREAENGAHPLIRQGLLAPVALSSHVICNSRATADFVTTSAIDNKRLSVVHNGKDWSSYFQSPVRPQSKASRVVVIGRLSPRKGQRTVIEAIAQLRHEGVELKVRFVGDVFEGYEWYAEELKSTARDLGVLDLCQFSGFAADVTQHLEWADICVVPSLIEPFGTVALEAMAAARPVISSATEGLVEIVDDNRTGLTYAPGDATDLARKLHRLAGNLPLRERLSQAGHSEVHEKFSAERYASLVSRILEEAARPRKRTTQ